MVYYSALHYAAKAEKSATSAANSAAQASQASGKIIQLGFDGAIEDGKLVFKHAPAGVEIPYELLDDYEYEVDLAYNGDLDSLTTMVVKNGADTITFVSALHRDSMTPATVKEMQSVARYNTDTGYRWLFKAAYKITPSGAKVFLLYPVVAKEDTSNITNCITEIPQDIKLELKDGVLTLKAGSKVYIPNGAGIFDKLTVSNDIAITGTWGAAGTVVVFVKNNLTGMDIIDVTRLSSGATVPTEQYTRVWFDTTNGLIKKYASGSDTGVRYSLPLCICTKASSAEDAIISSIDQVFNGFGYIGSTLFALPGVKGLIPDGRNEDGSLRNKEFTLTKVIMKTISNTSSNLVAFVNNETIHQMLDWSPDGDVGKTYSAWYDKATNYNYYRQADTSVVIGKWGAVLYSNSIKTDANAKITEMTSNLTFRAIDYSDSSWVAAQGMPSSKYINLTIGASDSTYTAPANGEVCLRVRIDGTWGQAYIHRVEKDGTVTIGSYTIGADTSWSNQSVPPLRLKKGDVFMLKYVRATPIMFRFYYAEGEN